jgi:hypothetical protein
MAKNIPAFSIPRPSKIYPNWDFWYENIPSGNPNIGFLKVRKTIRLSIFSGINNESWDDQQGDQIGLPP